MIHTSQFCYVERVAAAGDATNIFWQVMGWTSVGLVVGAFLFLVWVWIESELHAKRKRKMEEQDALRKYHGSAGPLEAGYREAIKRAQRAALDNEDFDE